MITKEEFIELCNKHLFPTETSCIDQYGNQVIEVYGVTKLFHALQMYLLSKTEKLLYQAYISGAIDADIAAQMRFSCDLKGMASDYSATKIKEIKQEETVQ